MEQRRVTSVLNIGTIQVIALVVLSIILFRALETLYEEIAPLETKDIRKRTGCTKPCKYTKYNFIGEAQTTSFQSEDYSLSLWAVSNDTWVETEVEYKQQDILRCFQRLFLFCSESRRLSGADLPRLLPSCRDRRHSWSLPWFFLHCGLGRDSTSRSIFTICLLLYELEVIGDAPL